MAAGYPSKSLRDKIVDRLSYCLAITKAQMQSGHPGVKMVDIDAVLADLSREGLVESTLVPVGKNVFEVWFLSDVAPLVRQQYEQRFGQGMRYLRAG